MWRETATAAVLGVLLLLISGQARALDPESTQAYCDQVRDASRQAQLRYVSTFKPRQDPGKTFDDATSSCLDFIMSYRSSFQFTLPSMAMVQEILQQMAKQMLQRACQAARDQFDRSVQDAMNTVNEAGQLPGGLGGVTVTGHSTPSPAPRQPGPAQAPAEPSTWESVVNFLSGRKP